ncbi:hypothetical protein THF1C08_190045 [Vibrio jasicida]|uniref:Uncharacterized protein n=1 Tax=Vibrio jasicida TaxID=766224 RepID=A0AAU9QKQ9_9VIBR|nr:hypothetical protein THF1C08_190045 [Vibrio jasicida]CAH1588311.1 hypothetical protein THF1A12_200045 [Vibrio jasicida]
MENQHHQKIMIVALRENKKTNEERDEKRNTGINENNARCY